MRNDDTLGGYYNALTFLEAYLLDFPPKPISRAGALHRLDRMPHSFLPVGDGVHLLPITINGFPVGFSNPPGTCNLSRFKDRVVPEHGIDRDYLLPGGLLFDDVEKLLTPSPEGRRELALRSYRVFRHLGFPFPKMPYGTCLRIGTRLKNEAEQRRQERGDVL